MDKFVVRTQKHGSLVPSGSVKKKVYNQLAIERLKGVVVIEDILKINKILRAPDQDAAALVQSLEQLAQKTPSRDILKSTKIGHAVKRLAKHSDERVAHLAKLVIHGWQSHFEAKLAQPAVDVQCDRKTESIRQTARKQLTSALLNEEAAEEPAAGILAKDIELQFFHSCRRIINGKYQRAVRRLVLALQQRESLRRDVVDGRLNISQLVSDYIR